MLDTAIGLGAAADVFVRDDAGTQRAIRNSLAAHGGPLSGS